MDLLIDAYGTFIGASGERIVLKIPQKAPAKIKKGTPRPRIQKEYPIRKLRKIVILRPSSISMHAVQLALEHEVDIVYLGAFGKPVGRIFSSDPRGLATLRRAQLAGSLDPQKSLDLAQSFVSGKCANQIRFMRQLGASYEVDVATAVAQAEAVHQSIEKILPSQKANEELLGMEGYIADKYWGIARRLFAFPGRIPRGRDKFNSALYYGYWILYNEIERACLYVGLDPYLGLYHSERYGKPALVLDLIEEFRVPVVDAAIIPLFAGKKLGVRGDFERVARGEYRLSPQGKYKVVESVLRKLNQKAFHRGKTREVKAIVQDQCRLLARIFLGKEKSYRPFSHSVSLS